MLILWSESLDLYPEIRGEKLSTNTSDVAFRGGSIKIEVTSPHGLLRTQGLGESGIYDKRKKERKSYCLLTPLPDLLPC